MIFAIYDAGNSQHLADAFRRLTDAEILCTSDIAQLSSAGAIDLLFLPLRHLALSETLCRDSELVLLGDASALTPDSLRCRPIGFLPYDAEDKAIIAIIDRFLSYRSHPSRVYAFHNREQMREIPHNSICYFHSSGHYAVVHTDSGEELQQPRKLDDIERELSALPYLRCHQRYLVHLPHVDYLDHPNMCLMLRSGESVPVSKRLFGRVVNAILARNQI